MMSLPGRLVLLLVSLSIAAVSATEVASKPPERLNAADGRLAKRLTLHLSDLPAGWRVEKISNSGGAKCSAPDFPKGLVVSGKATSSFSMSQTDLALSLGGVVTTVGGAKAVFALYGRDLPSCLLAAAKHAGKDASVGAMSFPHVGFQSAAWSAQTTISGVSVYFDAIIVRAARRAFAAYLFGGVGSANTDQEIRLVRRAVARA